MGVRIIRSQVTQSNSIATLLDPLLDFVAGDSLWKRIPAGPSMVSVYKKAFGVK